MFKLRPGIEYTFSLTSFWSSGFTVSIAWCKELAAKIRTIQLFGCNVHLFFLFIGIIGLFLRNKCFSQKFSMFFFRSCYPKTKHTFTNTNIKKFPSVCFGNKTFREPKVNLRGHGSTSRGRWLASREQGLASRDQGWPLVGHGWAFGGSRVGLWWVTGGPLVGHGLASGGSLVGLWWVTGWPLNGHHVKFYITAL